LRVEEDVKWIVVDILDVRTVPAVLRTSVTKPYIIITPSDMLLL
jgi:hypothetical protein